MQSPSYTGPIYYVRSSEPTRFYAVTVSPATDLYACECPDHVYRSRDCKHIRAAQAGQVQPATPKRAPVPTRPAPTPPAPVPVPAIRRGADILMPGIITPVEW